MFKKIAKRALSSFFRLFPLKDVILFESFPDFSDSTIMVYHELVKRGYNQKYQFKWLCHEKKSLRNPSFLSIYINNKIKSYYYRNTAKFIINNNMIMGIARKGQQIIYLSHGAPAKAIKNYYHQVKDLTAAINICPYLKDDFAYQFGISSSLVYGLGLPRNDELITSKVNLHNYFNYTGKIIFYYPTVKVWNEKGLETHGAPFISNILTNEQDYEKMNKYLNSKNILLVIKLHYCSAKEESTNYHYSNILFVDESFFTSHKTTSYQCLAKCDALLTDYSSVFYDYLYVNKPIGFIWADLAQYRNNPGLDDEFINHTHKCGEKILNITELEKFIDNINQGVDNLKDSRSEIRKKIFPYEENMSTKRVTDFIVKTFEL